MANGLYKAELTHRRAPWKTKEAVEFATLEWVPWFNHHRLLEPISYIPPAEAEAKVPPSRQVLGLFCVCRTDFIGFDVGQLPFNRIWIPAASFRRVAAMPGIHVPHARCLRIQVSAVRHPTCFR